MCAAAGASQDKYLLPGGVTLTEINQREVGSQVLQTELKHTWPCCSLRQVKVGPVCSRPK